MLQQILDNIEGILVELIDNQIDFDFDVKDKRDKFLRFDIRFFPEFIRDGGSSRYFPYLEFYGRDGKLKPYIKEALLTLDTYLKNKLMYVKVHSLFGNEGIMMSIPEFTRIEGSMATSIKMFTIGISVNHLARGKANRNIKEKRINSYSQFINEAFDKNSIKDFCERYLAYLLDNEDFSISLTVPRRGGASFWTNSEGPQIRIYNNRELVRWNDIKDHIIPFLAILNKEYNCFPNVDFNIANNRVGTNSVIVTHRIKDLIEDTQITNRGFNLITISLRSNQSKFRAKRFLTEELIDITTNVSGSGRSKEVARIYNDEDADIKSPAAGILLNHKFRKEEMDSIITAVQKNVKSKDFNTKPKDPKLQRISVLINNLQFLKDTLQDKGRLQCEYCGKGPLIIYDVAPDKFNKLIDNPYYRLNTNFDAEWGATCDHKNPQSLGGDKFDYSNLAVCCNRCNQRKKSIPYNQWMKMIGKTNESKRFNESVNEYDLKEYCETNLAYLMDDGLKVEPDFYNGSEYNELDELSVQLSWGGHRKKWSEIKDHIIPFLHRLRNEYDLDEVYFGNDPDTAEYRNKFFRFSVQDWDKPTINGVGSGKEIHLSYDELESLSNDTLIQKIIFWVKI